MNKRPTTPLLENVSVGFLTNFNRKCSELTGSLPAVAETLPGVVATEWFAIFAAEGTPLPVINNLKSEIDEALKKRELLERLKAIKVIPQEMTEPELMAFLNNEIIVLG